MKNKKLQMVRHENSQIKTDFLYWLAGLRDGDGYFSMSKTVSTNKNTGKIYSHSYPRFELTTHMVEKINISGIKAVLGFGAVSNKSKISCRYRVHNKGASKALIELLNGKLRLKKRLNQFELVCNSMGIRILDANKQKFSENAWLSGFFEADGYFRVNRKNLQFCIKISQVDREVLDAIQLEFGGSIHRSFSKKSQRWCWVYECSKASNMKMWMNYLDKYSPKGPKKVQYILFKELIFCKSRKDYKDSKLRGGFFKKVKFLMENKDYDIIIENSKLQGISIAEYLKITWG